MSTERHADTATESKSTGNQQIKNTGDRICHREGGQGESNTQERNGLCLINRGGKGKERINI